MADIFISYATPDRETAKRIADCLREQGYSVWWDRTIPPGRHFDEVIQEALEAAKCVIVLWSKASVRSNWVKTEAAEAQSGGRLVPATIESVTPPMEFKRIQAADLSQWDDSADYPEFGSLLASIKSRMQQVLPSSLPAAAAQAQAPSPPGATTLRGNPPPFRIEISRRAVWISAGTLAIVALTWALYTAPKSSADGTASSPSSSSSTTEPASPRGRGNENATSAANGTASSPSTPSITTEPASPGQRGNETPQTRKRFNLLSSKNQGRLVVADNKGWNAMIDGEEVFAILGTSSAVFAFRENRAAAFDTFAVLIPAADQFNLREFELLAGNDSPTGVFESIGRFVTVNSRIIDTPYQEFRFPEVKAKYLKVTALDTHFKPSPANGSLMAYEIMLFGRLL